MPETTINTTVSEIMTSVPFTEAPETILSESSAETAITVSAVTENDDEIISRAAESKVSEIFESMGVTLSEETVSETETETAVSTSEAAVIDTETELSTLLPPETTSAEITAGLTDASSAAESAAEESIQTSAIPVMPVTASDPVGYTQYIFPAAALAVLGSAAAVMVLKKKRNKKSENKSAKDKDAERIEASRTKRSKKKDRSDKAAAEKTNLSKKVLDTVPYKKILADNIWFLGKKMYSKAYTFDDINFNLADEEQQYMYLEKYIEFMNVLDDTVDCQICLWNSKINIEDFRHRTLMQQRADDFFNLRFEYNTRVLEENIKKGQNAIQKHMYITLTIKAPDEETAARKFKSLDIAAVNSFNRIGNTNMRELTSQERVEMLKNFFIGTNENPVPALTSEDYEKGTEKLYCAPDYFDFKKDYFMFNDTYAKTVFIRDYPSTATSEIFTDLLAAGIEIMITTNIETYDTAAARKLVQHQITAIDTDMASVRSRRHSTETSHRRCPRE